MFHQGQSTDYIDLLTILEDLLVNSHVDTLAVNAGGSNWAVGDLFDINGGTVVGGHNATGEILAESGGVATSVRVFSGGAYTANPGTGATTTALGASIGTGLTVDTTIAATGWSVDRSQIYSSPERELLLQGTGGGSDEIYVGIQTDRDVGTSTFFWKVAGATGFDNGELWEDQPGSSWSAVTNTDECYVPLNNGIIDFWLFADTYHFKMVMKSGSSYSNCYLGFLNQFATPDEFPYPLIVLGCSTSILLPYNTSGHQLSGLVMPTSDDSAGRGPGAIRRVDGSWKRLRSNYIQSTSKVVISTDALVWPEVEVSNTENSDPADEFMINVSDQNPSTWFAGFTTGTPAALLDVTPDSGGDIQFLWPNMIFEVYPEWNVLGEMMDVYPLSATGLGLVSEDTITDANGDVYICFQNCNRTDAWAFFALKRT